MPTATQAATPAMRELLRDMRDDLEIVPGQSGHFLVVHKDSGEPLRLENGQPVTVPSTPKRSGHAFESTRKGLAKAGVFKDNGQPKPKRKTTPLSEEQMQLRIEKGMATRLGADRVEATNELRARLDPIISKVGGWNNVRSGDMARIAARVHGDWLPESALVSVSWFLAGKALAPGELERLDRLVTFLENAPDPRAAWFGQLREVLGLEAETLPGRNWPFKMKLLNLDLLIPDYSYQRPIQESFVRDLVLRFDERLVGVLNVSARDDGSFAIIDGLQRRTAMERVGKTAVHCAVHEGLSVQQEAALFYHHNRDRKPVHPYYDYRARLVAGDPVIAAIDEIVSKQGFRVDIRSQSKTPGERERHIAAIRSLEEVFSMGTEVRPDALTPTLSVIWRNWLGRPYATDATMIRGMGRFFRVFADEEITWEPWEKRLNELGPHIVIGRAADLGGRQTRAVAISETLVNIHNDATRKSADHLDPRLVRAQRVQPRFV